MLGPAGAATTAGDNATTPVATAAKSSSESFLGDINFPCVMSNKGADPKDRLARSVLCQATARLEAAQFGEAPTDPESAQARRLTWVTNRNPGATSRWEFTPASGWPARGTQRSALPSPERNHPIHCRTRRDNNSDNWEPRHVLLAVVLRSRSPPLPLSNVTERGAADRSLRHSAKDQSGRRCSASRCRAQLSRRERPWAAAAAQGSADISGSRTPRMQWSVHP